MRCTRLNNDRSLYECDIKDEKYCLCNMHGQYIPIVTNHHSVGCVWCVQLEELTTESDENDAGVQHVHPYCQRPTNEWILSGGSECSEPGSCFRISQRNIITSRNIWF